MARVLVTGQRGQIGTALTSYLQQRGYECCGLDLVDGTDMCDPTAFYEAARGCESIVHLAAVCNPMDEWRTYKINMRGLWNGLAAAGRAGVKRFIFASSVNAMGLFWGERRPDYLPFDETHKCYPTSPYGISKYRGERLCARFTRATGIPTLCLRPPAVWNDSDIATVLARRTVKPRVEWKPFWEYGAYVHLNDLVRAFHAALRCGASGHHRLLVVSDDVCSVHPSRRLARKIMRRVPWHGGVEYEQDPYRSLVSNALAKEILKWQPAYRWPR